MVNHQTITPQNEGLESFSMYMQESVWLMRDKTI